MLAALALGPKLTHIATINIEIEAEAFAFARSVNAPIVYGISRPNLKFRAFRLPEVAIPENVRPLTELSFELA